MSTLTFQDMILKLSAFWSEQGCVISQPLDLPMGAATFHPATFVRAIGPKPWKTAFQQGCRRPTDGRYGENPNRLQHYYQYQVILKPAPDNIQELYIQSLKELGIDRTLSDLRFVEDNWESPSLGAWGLGWEVWLDGMEVSQFTYFQQIGGLPCDPISGEITYGLERLALFIQGKNSVYDLVFASDPQTHNAVLYGDVFHQNEVEYSRYNFESANIPWLLQQFEAFETEANRLMEQALLIPAYEMILRASEHFNLLDARGAFSVTERQHNMLRIQNLAKKIALLIQEREISA